MRLHHTLSAILAGSVSFRRERERGMVFPLATQEQPNP